MKNDNGENKKFEFCEVCRLNHNQGHRHVYFPRHKSSLSTILTRFQSKFSDVKLHIRTPTVNPDLSEKNLFWCIFCNRDILELDSPFPNGNAIKHLASGEHRKRVKSFMWRHGGGIDKVDLFCIAEVDFSKWEKKCKSLKTEAAKEESVRNSAGPLNNIHNELNTNYVNNFHKNNVNFLDFNTTNSVMPLQSSTFERAQVSCSGLSTGPEAGYSWHDMPGDIQIRDAKCLKTPTGCMNNFLVNSVTQECSSTSYHSNRSVNSGVRIANGESRSPALLNLTQISSTSREVVQGNVHTGAPPPWFNAEKPEQSNLIPSKAGKSTKLNPKRVGAAWAERRVLELELERRGERVTNNIDTNWLPNFGGVWQSGTRKESRKEFQTKNKSSLKVDNQSERLEIVQPYISKRMRRDSNE